MPVYVENTNKRKMIWFSTNICYTYQNLMGVAKGNKRLGAIPPLKKILNCSPISFCACKGQVESSNISHLVSSLPSAIQYFSYMIEVQNYSVLARFDCACFIQSMHSSAEPEGCASCHSSSFCCCGENWTISKYL